MFYKNVFFVKINLFRIKKYKISFHDFSILDKKKINFKLKLNSF